MMDAGMDTGDIVLQVPSEIGPRETYGELHDRFARLGAQMLAKAVPLAAAGLLQRRPQTGLAPAEAVAATLTRPLSKADLAVDWDWTAQRIANHVRSLSPAPAARAELAGEHVKLVDVVPAGDARPDGVAPGTPTAVCGTALLVACSDGQVAVERLVPPNRSAMSGAQFARARSAV